MALRKDQIGDQQSRKYPFGKTGLLLGFGGLAVFVLLGAMNHGRMIGYAIFDVSAALVAGWVVWSASIGIDGLIGRLLEVRPLLYLGTISYGIYVYHKFIPYVMYKILGLRSIVDVLALPYAWPLDSLLKGGITVFVAVLSWHYFRTTD